MYHTYFEINKDPFAITPDTRFLYMSAGHREAMACLLYGMAQGGGFVVLTGEVGTGKTTLCRSLLEEVPSQVDVALILNPKQSSVELISSICDELQITYPAHTTSVKTLVDSLNHHLLAVHSKGRRTVVVIDEAQNLSMEVLEQIRLLTNLETSTQKLLEIILIGQPELLTMLAKDELRQLAQRVTARYHLGPLALRETASYIQHRLEVAGYRQPLFTKSAISRLHRLSGGIPRRLNIICDRALMGAYVEGRKEIDKKLVNKAALEVLGPKPSNGALAQWLLFAFLFTLFGAGLFIIPRIIFQPDASEYTELSAGKETSSDSKSTEFAEPAGFISIGSDNPEAKNETAENTAPSQQTPEVEPQTPPETSATPEPKAVVANSKPETIPTAAALPKQIGETNALLRGADGRPIYFSELLQNKSVKTDSFVAFSTLFTYWQQDFRALKGKTACDRALTVGLRCLLQSDGNWVKLRNYNRPAVLELVDPSGKLHQVVVTGLDGKNVTFDFERRIVKLPYGEVEPFWRGDYLLLWNPPSVETSRLSLGSEGPDVVWLRNQLDIVEGRSVNVNDQSANLRFDEALQKRVKNFQRSHGLFADGIAGPQTLILLNAVSGDPSIPLLWRSGE